MKFSTRSEYGLRLMIELAKTYGHGPRSLSKVALKEGISLPYLERIVSRLKSKGLVKSVRGVSGGYILGRKPKELTVGEVIDVLERPLNFSGCLICRKKVDCGTKMVWEKVNQNVVQTLNSLTLNDLITRGGN